MGTGKAFPKNPPPSHLLKAEQLCYITLQPIPILLLALGDLYVHCLRKKFWRFHCCLISHHRLTFNLGSGAALEASSKNAAKKQFFLIQKYPLSSVIANGAKPLVLNLRRRSAAIPSIEFISMLQAKPRGLSDQDRL